MLGAAGPPPRQAGGDRAAAALREAGQAREGLRRAEKRAARARERAQLLEGELAAARGEAAELRWSGAKLERELSAVKEAARAARARGRASLAGLQDSLAAVEGLVARRATEGYCQVAGIHAQLQELQAAVVGGGGGPGAAGRSGTPAAALSAEAFPGVQRRFGEIMKALAVLLTTLASTDGGCLLEQQMERAPVEAMPRGEGGDDAGASGARAGLGIIWKDMVGAEVEELQGELKRTRAENRQLAEALQRLGQRGRGEGTAGAVEAGSSHTPVWDSEESPKITEYRAAITRAQGQVASLHERLEQSAHERDALKEALHTRAETELLSGCKSEVLRRGESQQLRLKQEELERALEELRTLRAVFKGRIEAERLRADDLQNSHEESVRLLHDRCAGLEDRLAQAKEAGSAAPAGSGSLFKQERGSIMCAEEEGFKDQAVEKLREDLRIRTSELAAAQEKIASLGSAIEAKEVAQEEERQASKEKQEILQNKLVEADADRRSAGQDAVEKIQQETEVLRRQVAELKDWLSESEAGSRDALAEAESLRNLVATLQSQVLEGTAPARDESLMKISELEEEVSALRAVQLKSAKAAEETVAKETVGRRKLRVEGNCGEGNCGSKETVGRLQEQEGALQRMQSETEKVMGELEEARGEFQGQYEKMQALERAVSRAESAVQASESGRQDELFQRDGDKQVVQQELEALKAQQVQLSARYEDVKEKERRTRAQMEALLQKEEGLKVTVGELQEALKQHACCAEAIGFLQVGKEEALNLVKTKDEALRKKDELLGSAVVKLQEQQRFQREATTRLKRAEKSLSEYRANLESAEAEIEALQEEREDLLLQNSALDAAFEQKHAEVVALQESLRAKTMEIQEAVSLAACGGSHPAAPAPLVSGALRAIGAALADLGTALRPESKEGSREQQGSCSLLSEDRQSTLFLEAPASEYGDVLQKLSSMGLNLGTDALPWSVRNLEPPLSDGRRVLRAELDELDNEIAQVQARGGLLFSPGDTGLTP